MFLLLPAVLLAARLTQSADTPEFPPAVEAVAERPNVFKSRTYLPKALPTFSEAKSHLPEPVIQIHPEWVRLYWKAWELAFAHLKQPDPGSGFVSNFIDPAFNANTFQWDTCFMLQFAHYAEPTFHAIGSLDNFYAKQHPDGYICREIVRKTGEDYMLGGQDNTINPPLFSWVEWQNYLLTGDKSRFRDVLPRLIKYYGWIREHRRRPNGLYWNTGLGAGEDDLARNATAYSWLDMSAQQVQNAYYIALIAKEIGEAETSSYFEKDAIDLTKLINDQMWDPGTGFYYDLKQDGSKTGVKTVLGFWPLLAHVASVNQLRKIAKHLADNNEFDRPDPVPALAANEPGYTPDGQYWNGAVWAPTNLMVVKGLQDYGLEDDAERISAKYLANMSKVLTDTGTIWENYAPEFAVGHGARDMVGWSGIGPIALLIENIIGIRTSAANHEVTWRIRLTGENGIKNLTMGDTHMSLLASKEIFGKRVITVTTDRPFKLNMDVGDNQKHEFDVNLGTSQFGIPAPYVFTMTYPPVDHKDAVYNLSVNHPVLATSEQSPETKAANVVDGSQATVWASAASSPQSISVDLGEKREIFGVNLFWDAAYAKVYSVEVSSDGKVWEKLFESSNGKGGGQALRVQPTSARYVRINCLVTDGTHKFFALQEFQVLGR